MKSGSRLIVTAAVIALFAGLVGAGGAEGAAAEPFARHDPAAFEERMKNEQAMVINVHVPYEGELTGTDAFIPYDRIKGDPRLPKDKGTELLLYCKTGRMSEEAAVDLHEEGYTNIAHLEGGMKGWEASGRQVVYNPENAARQSGPHNP
jgi:rhodanese-related sulfurtransferase